MHYFYIILMCLPYVFCMVYDCVIVGGGFAGLSAAIYLARYNRSVFVVGDERGRWHTHEINENYLGFPDGIAAVKLRQLGLQQAQHFGAVFAKDTIKTITCEDGFFQLEGENTYKGKTVILATGVTDNFPDVPNQEAYIGRSLFWCITCDGYKVRDKVVTIYGNSDHAVVTCLQFVNFTKKLQFLAGGYISPQWKEVLQQARIPYYEGEIVGVSGTDGMIQYLTTDTHLKLATEFLFSIQEASPNNMLAKQIGIKLDEKGYVLTDREQRTNRAKVYAAGDITKQFIHQIVTAAHEGATAACAANYDLYLPWQRHE